MNRLDIIDRIGRERLTSNAENGEFSYPKALRNKGLKISDYKRRIAGTASRSICASRAKGSSL